MSVGRTARHETRHRSPLLVVAVGALENAGFELVAHGTRYQSAPLISISPLRGHGPLIWLAPLLGG